MDTERWEQRRQRWEQRHEMRRLRWEQRACRNPRRSVTHGLFFGAIVVAVGCLLLLDNLGIFRFHDVWHYWPVLLIAWGISRLIDSCSTSGYVWGGAATLIGAFLMLDALDIISFNAALIWPIVLIAFGIGVLIRAMERGRYQQAMPPPSPGVPPLVNANAIFDKSNSGIDTKEFRGGEVNAVFGGAHFDLRGASMPDDEAQMEVNVVFGGVEIFLPNNWNVVSRASVVFGGIDDRTSHPRPDPNIKTPTLILTGSVVFGGISLYN